MFLNLGNNHKNKLALRWTGVMGRKRGDSDPRKTVQPFGSLLWTVLVSAECAPFLSYAHWEAVPFQPPRQGHTRRRCITNVVFLIKGRMKWAPRVQWECPALKGRQETPGTQEFLLWDFLEKEVHQVPQDPQVRKQHALPFA